MNAQSKLRVRSQPIVPPRHIDNATVTPRVTNAFTRAAPSPASADELSLAVNSLPSPSVSSPPSPPFPPSPPPPSPPPSPMPSRPTTLPSSLPLSSPLSMPPRRWLASESSPSRAKRGVGDTSLVCCDMAIAVPPSPRRSCMAPGSGKHPLLLLVLPSKSQSALAPRHCEATTSSANDAALHARIFPSSRRVRLPPPYLPTFFFSTAVRHTARVNGEKGRPGGQRRCAVGERIYRAASTHGATTFCARAIHQTAPLQEARRWWG